MRLNQFKIRICSFMICSLFVTSWVFAESPRHAVLQEIRGGVEVKIGSEDWKPAEPQTTLYERDEIKTADDGFALILLDEKGATGQLELKEKSHLKLDTLLFDDTSGDKHTLLDLAIGRVLVHAEKLQGSSTFEVKTPTSTTGVRGTTFEVSVEEKN